MTKLTVETPIGRMRFLENGGRLWISCKEDYAEHFAPLFNEATESDSPVLAQAHRELKEYFDGKRFSFSVPLGVQVERWEMGSPFETRAWQTLTKIGFGRTISYKEQALWMGHPKAIRAVGRANGKNPLMIFVPCHRVIGANGALTGFGGGLETKAFLLKHEADLIEKPELKGREHHFAVLK